MAVDEVFCGEPHLVKIMTSVFCRKLSLLAPLFNEVLNIQSLAETGPAARKVGRPSGGGRQR